MDKIVRNKFWILAVLVLPLVMYGYYSANGALKEATTTRETELDGIKGKISAGNEPNDDYAARLKKINEFLETEIDREILKLWDNQQKRMVWPSSVAQEVPEEFMGEFGFDQLVIYKEQYAGLMQDLQYHAEPVLPTNDPFVDDESRRQKVILAATLPSSEFGSLSITSKQMWDAQMDIWLVDLLFDSFKNINRDKDSVTEAVVRRIDVLQLWGGDGKPALGGAAGGSGGEDAYMMDMAGSEGSGGGGTGSTNVTSSVPFSPTQEFGSGGSPKSAAGGPGGGGDDYMITEGAGDSGSSSEAKETLRFIAEDEAAPFVERGFYLSVIIMQNKIPDFIVELANSDWPVRVTRFNVGKNPYAIERSGNYASGGGGFELGGSDPELNYEPSGFSGGPGSFGGNQFGAGEFGPSGLSSGAVLAGGMSSGLPPHAQAAMNHPDLVQLDLCGVITIYRQPTEVIEKLKTAEEAAGATPAMVSPSSANGAETEAMEVDPGQVPTPEVGTPAIDNLDGAGAAPVDPDVPGADEPSPDNPVPETPFPATPPASPAAPASTETSPAEAPAAETPVGEAVPFTP